MIVAQLRPAPLKCAPFRRDARHLVPQSPGNYVLATFEQRVLYVGLASSLRSRLEQHLDDPKKVGASALGRAFFFHWLESSEIELVERTWMNMHFVEHACLPPMNRAFSPVRT